MRRSMLHYERLHFGQYSLSQEGPSNVHGLRNYYLGVTRDNQTALMFLLDSWGVDSRRNIRTGSSSGSVQCPISILAL